MSATAVIRLGFSDEELMGRRRYLGGSDAACLMSGSEPDIYDLWLRKTGKAPEPDLSDNLAVQCGIWTEELNARWYSRVTGRAVTGRNTFRRSDRYPWMACNLDGLTSTPSTGEPAVFEAKWSGAYTDLTNATQRYYWQLAHNMLTIGVERAVLSVITGKPSYEMFEAELDEFEAVRLIEREKAFWACVERDEPPPGFKPAEAPVPVSEWRSVDMTGSNTWAVDAADWLATRDAAKTFDNAAKSLKGAVERDVNRASGHGVCVTRSKSGALTVKEEKRNA